MTAIDCGKNAICRTESWCKGGVVLLCLLIASTVIISAFHGTFKWTGAIINITYYTCSLVNMFTSTYYFNANKMNHFDMQMMNLIVFGDYEALLCLLEKLNSLHQDRSGSVSYTSFKSKIQMCYLFCSWLVPWWFSCFDISLMKQLFNFWCL